jgi:hypothetical protein
LLKHAFVQTRSILMGGLSITALLLAAGCSSGAAGGGAGGGNGGSNGGSNSAGSSGIVGSTAASGTSCPSGEQVVASTDGYISGMTVAGTYVYLNQSGAPATNGNGLSGPTFARVPVGGGAVETLDEDGATVFGASDAGIVAWAKGNNTGALVGVQMLDANGQHTLTLPMGASYVSSIAVDGAGNVFVLANASTGGNDVYRYSVVRQTFDLLHHNLAGLQGFYKDGKGIAWLGPGNAGTPALFHEDVLGGAPVEGPSLPDASQIAGIDAKAVYQLNGTTIRATDRASGEQSVALDTSIAGDTRGYPSMVTSDDTNFYWVSTEAGGSGGSASIYRASKLEGSPQSFATADQIGNIALGSCSLAYLSGANAGTFTVVTRPK